MEEYSDKTAKKRRKKNKRKKLPVGTKRRVMTNHKRRNPAKFRKNKVKRKIQRRLNVGPYIKQRMKNRIEMRKPINRLRKNLRQK